MKNKYTVAPQRHIKKVLVQLMRQEAMRLLYVKGGSQPIQTCSEGLTLFCCYMPQGVSLCFGGIN